MKPVCVPCRTFYRPAKTGTYFEEGMPAETAGAWDSYKLWAGDLWGARRAARRSSSVSDASH